MDYEALAKELVRHVRGKRSQRSLSRRLGHRSNVLYRWETGRAWPSGAQLFQLLTAVGMQPGTVVRAFLPSPTARARGINPTDAASVAALLRALKGDISIQLVATRTGLSRFFVSRCLSGKTQPRLPDFLRLIDALTLRSLDFVAAIADPEALPSVGSAWRMLQASRQAAYDHPLSHAVLRVLELEPYQRLKKHRRGWIAARIGIDVAEEERCLEVLRKAEQIRLVRGLWQVNAVATIDTRRSPEEAARLRAFWLDVAAQRQRAGTTGVFAYNLCSLSHADLERLKELHNAFFRSMQELVARSEPCERVALLCTQLLPLD